MIGFYFSIRFTRQWCQFAGYLSLGFIHIKIHLVTERNIPELEMLEVKVEMNGENEIIDSNGKVYKARKVSLPKPPPKRIPSYPTSSSRKVDARRDPTKQKTVLRNTPIIGSWDQTEQIVEVRKEVKPTMPSAPPHPTIARRELTAVEEANPHHHSFKSDDRYNHSQSIEPEEHKQTLRDAAKTVEEAEKRIKLHQKLNDDLEKSGIPVNVNVVRPTEDLDKPFFHKFFGSQFLVGNRMIIGNLPRKLHTLEIIGKRMMIDNTQYPINEGDLENLKRVIREARA